MVSHNAAVAVRTPEGFRFEVTSVSRPEVQPWEVLVKLSATGVCGTDIALAAGHLGPSCDILGHEGVGRVVELGAGVNPSTVKIGDRVGITWVRDICGQCDCCREPGGETRCLQQLNSGRKIDGTFAEHAVVPSRYVLAIPEDSALPDELVAPILCGGVTAYKALKMCGATPGQWIAILGASGGVGALGVQYAKAMGYRVVAIDVGPASREYCLKLGAEVYFDATDDDVVAAVKAATSGSGVNAAIVAAGSGKAYQSALSMLAVFGSLVCIGIPPPDQTLNLHPLEIIDKGIRLVGTLVGTRSETLEALNFVKRGVVRPDITVIRLEELNEASKKLTTGKGKVVIRF